MNEPEIISSGNFEEILPKEYWKAKKEGDSIAGEVVNIEDDKDDGTSYEIAGDHGTLWTPTHKVLQKMLAYKNITMQDFVVIQYVRDKDSKNPAHSPMKLYRVWVRKRLKNGI